MSGGLRWVAVDLSTSESLFLKSLSVGELILDSFSEEESFIESNNGVRTSKNLFLHKNNKNNVKKCQNQLFADLQKYLKTFNNPGNIIQEKQVNFSNSSNFCDILAFSILQLFSSFSFQYCDSLENCQPCEHNENQQPRSTEGEKFVMEP